MTAIYTSPDAIKRSFKFLDTVFIDDDTLTGMIECAQGQIDSLIKTSHLSDFVLPKHQILKELCTQLVIVKCIACAPDSFYSPEDRSHCLEILYNIIKIDEKLLSDPVRVELLK
ncbi:TPA_asm: hypothetical protein [Altiarchaeum virus]|nr:TPA_asm: hypothetical protein [Altiarchaeum virus]